MRAFKRKLMEAYDSNTTPFIPFPLVPLVPLAPLIPLIAILALEEMLRKHVGGEDRVPVYNINI